MDIKKHITEVYMRICTNWKSAKTTLGKKTKYKQLLLKIHIL